MRGEGILTAILRIIEALVSILARISKANQAVAFDVRFGLPTNKHNQGNTMIEVTITNEQKVKATVAPKTASGKPAKIDGTPTWTVVTGEATIEESEDGLSAFLISGDTPGFSEIAVKADADIGEGVEEISQLILLTVEGAKATALGVTLGQPEDK